jgi:hypothetical protein
MTEIVQGPRPNGLHTVAAEDDATTIADLQQRVLALERRAAALELAVLLVRVSAFQLARARTW